MYPNAKFFCKQFAKLPLLLLLLLLVIIFYFFILFCFCLVLLSFCCCRVPFRTFRKIMSTHGIGRWINKLTSAAFTENSLGWRNTAMHGTARHGTTAHKLDTNTIQCAKIQIQDTFLFLVPPEQYILYIFFS